MRIFLTRWMARWARREGITDARLGSAINRAARGLIDADLGGGLIKQRIARVGQGRSGGFRTIIVWRAGDLAIFIYGFAKNAREDIGDDTLRTMRDVAAAWLSHDDDAMENAVENGELREIDHDENA